MCGFTGILHSDKDCGIAGIAAAHDREPGPIVGPTATECIPTDRPGSGIGDWRSSICRRPVTSR